MAEQTTAPRSWQDILLTGVGAIIDSQRTQNYAVSDPAYNTQGGRAGQSQATTALQAAVSNPLVLVVGGLAVVALLVLVLKR